MPASHEFRFLNDDNGLQRIMPFKIPVDHHGKPAEDAYRRLNKILESYPGAEAGTMFDKKAHGHEVIVFEQPEDCLAFALTHGHIYGVK